MRKITSAFMLAIWLMLAGCRLNEAAAPAPGQNEIQPTAISAATNSLEATSVLPEATSVPPETNVALPATDTPGAVEAPTMTLPVAPEATETEPADAQPTATSPPATAAAAPPTDTPAPSIEGEPAAAIQLQPVVTSGLTRPVYLTHAADDRLFVLEQAGTVRIIQQGQLQAEPFLDIRDRVGSRSTEQGLLSLAFHPQYTISTVIR
jgi:hypothetical protein